MRSNRARHIAAGLALLLAPAACGTDVGTTTTTAAVAATTTQSQDTTTTTEPEATTTQPAETTTTQASSNEGAEGSGCTPNADTLPDGEWFGYVVTAADDELEFDLACWFTGEAAVRASADDGEESPPPNDYYVRNENESVRTVPVTGEAEVSWLPNLGDPTSETTVTYVGWIDLIEGRDLMPGIWLQVEDGVVVSLREQYVP